MSSADPIKTAAAAAGKQPAGAEPRRVVDAAPLPLQSGFHQILQLNAIATVLGASVLCALLWNEAPLRLLAGWWLLMILSSALMLVDRYVYMRRDRLRWWMILDVGTASFCGLSWGVLALAMPILGEDARLLVVAITAGVMGFSAPALSMVPVAGTLFLIGVAAPFAVYFATLGTTIGYGLSALLLGYVGMMLTTNYTLNRVLNRYRQLGEENAALYDRIQAAQSELLDIAESTEAFAFCDAAGNLHFWNRRFPELLGLDEAAMQRGQPLAELLARAGRPALALMAGQDDADMTLQLPSGRWVQPSRRVTPHGDRMLILIDITEQQKSSRQLQAQNQRLEDLYRQMAQARDTALRASQAKTTFLANMSHELRTPLNAIIGFSDIVQQKMFGPASAKYDEYIGDINASAHHLLGIINDILDLARIEASQIALNETAVYLDEEIATCARLAASQFGRDVAAVETAIAADLPPLHADARLVRQIMLNLLANALKFSPAGRPVQTGAQLNAGGGIDIWVRDRGIGIPKSEQDRIFEPFEQVDNQLSRKFDGVGLGLSLVRAFVLAHQGSIAIDSEPGRGTTITASFPPERSLRP